MSQIQSFSRNSCVLLAVLCGKHSEKRTPPGRSGPEAKRLRPSYPFPELSSAGRLEVHTLVNPTPEQFLEAQRAVQPNFLYIGQQLEDEKEIGSLVWGDADMSDPQSFICLISPSFPTIDEVQIKGNTLRFPKWTVTETPTPMRVFMGTETPTRFLLSR